MTGIFTSTSIFDKNRPRTVVFYGRVSTEHEAQLSALENQMQWYDDMIKYHPNWNVIDRYIDEGITGTQAKKRPSFLKMIQDAKAGKFDLIVTREVCRFARNTVDTLTYTRELKNYGVEVFFADDNIWTIDNDGEMRLSLLATFAQEESRKVSERVKAGQKISRDKGVLYGNGNILGYDRVGDTYVIDPEQAETVKIIFEMYANGDGGLRISKKLTELKRKNSSGLIKWDISTVLRIVGNATYKGYKCYNKSRSNNFLEQRRVLNLDDETYIYEKGDFEPIVSEELWDKCYALRKSKEKPSLVENGVVKKRSLRTTKDIWQQKLRCKCGSSFRKDVWHKNKDGRIIYRYNCYNRVSNGSAAEREKLGLDSDGYCDVKMLADWKLDLMGEEIIKSVWVNRKADAAKALELIRKYYKCESDKSTEKSAEFIQAQLQKLEAKKKNILNMRADGEIDKDEYAELKKDIEDEISRLKEQEQNISYHQQKQDDLFENLAHIEKALNSIVDFTDKDLSRQFMGNLIESIVPESQEHLIWEIHNNEKETLKVGCNVSGRKNKAVVSIDELLSENEGDLPSVHITALNPLLLQKLHRLLSNQLRNNI